MAASTAIAWDRCEDMDVQPKGRTLKTENLEDVSILFYNNSPLQCFFLSFRTQSAQQSYSWNTCLWGTRCLLCCHGTALVIWLETEGFIWAEALVDCVCSEFGPWLQNCAEKSITKYAVQLFHAPFISDSSWGLCFSAFQNVLRNWRLKEFLLFTFSIGCLR